MDFKDLLGLAKANQSYTEKKFDRDQQLKCKGTSQGVSSNAIKAFLARKEQEKAAKAAEAAARQRRIQERLEIARGKRKKSAVNEERPTEANTLRKKDVLRKADEISASERKLKPNPTSNEASKTSKSGSSSEARKADTKCKIKTAANSDTPEANKTLSSKSSKSVSSKDVPSHSNNKQKDIKSKDSQNDVMEKSGTSKIKSKTSKFKAGNKASLSFSDLMKVAKGQADKPVTAAKPKSKPQSNTVTDNVEPERRDVPHKNNSERKTTKREKDSSSKERLKESSSTSRKGTVTADTLKTENRSHKTEPRIKGKDIRSVSSTTNLKGVSAKGSSGSSSRDNKAVNSVSKTKTDYSKVSSSASSGSQLITQTVSNRLSYAPVQRRLSGEFKQQKVRNGDKSDARGIAAQSRTNTKKIDKELERERLELERQRRLLQMKMRKGKGFDEEEDVYDDDYGYDLDDDYDDDDDFIDDDGDDMDYSRHIRQIFGYDKRKYHDDDDDLRSMEVGYSQIQKEEARSARIAKLEDEIERMKEERELAKERAGAKKLKRS